MSFIQTRARHKSFNNLSLTRAWYDTKSFRSLVRQLYMYCPIVLYVTWRWCALIHFIIYKFLLLFFFQINGGNFEINTTQRDSNNISLVLSFHFFPLIFMQKYRTIELSDYRAVGLSSCRTLHTKGWAGGVCKQLEPPHQTKIQVLLSSIGSWFFFFASCFYYFYVPFENISLMWWRHHCRWKGTFLGHCFDAYRLLSMEGSL